MKPKLNAVSAVQARICVREQWINFEDPRLLKASPSWGEKLRDLFVKPKWKLKKELFLLLLRHLAQMELREHQGDEGHATIAVSTLVLRPSDNSFSLVPTEKGHLKINIPKEPLKQYLASADGHELAALVALGVRPEILGSYGLARNQGASVNAYVPKSSPWAAVKVVQNIQMSLRLSRESEPALQDLKSLGIVGHRGTITPDYLNFEAKQAVLAAASKQETINVARDILRMSRGISAQEIVEAVQIQLRLWDNVEPRALEKDQIGLSLSNWATWVNAQIETKNNPQEALHVLDYNMRTTIATHIAARAPSLSSLFYSRDDVI